LHAKLFIADLHADSLLWSRDLLEHGTRGHVDVPRLIEGNVALQAFTIVTKTPRNMNIENNTGDSDNIALLAVVEHWPIKTWSSLTERGLYQAYKLQDVANRSQGKFTLIRTSAELSAYLDRRKTEPQISAGILGIEGAHALDGNLDNIDRLFCCRRPHDGPDTLFRQRHRRLGARSLKGGLTDKGREMIRRMDAKKMIVDLSHASARTIDDVLAIATRPVVVSHTGVKGTCNNTRNLSDDQLIAIARTGGVIGIGFWDTAVCGTDAEAIAKAIRYTANLVGVDHVALGSDNDGAVTEPFEITALSKSPTRCWRKASPIRK
jgi:microsomal dipeptidase-like Zn-dependent dipeptidase